MAASWAHDPFPNAPGLFCYIKHLTNWPRERGSNDDDDGLSGEGSTVSGTISAREWSVLFAIQYHTHTHTHSDWSTGKPIL